MDLMILHLSALFHLSFPSVGNWVHYEALYEGEPLIIEKTVLSHDADTDVFQIRSKIQYRNEVLKNETIAQPGTFLYTPKKVEQVLQNCVRREGAIGEVTLDDQVIPVCEFYNEDSQLSEMIGPVPFGLIRFQVYLEDETFLDFHLTRFTL